MNEGYSVSLRFYEELNDFLPKEKKKTEYTLSYFNKPTVKDIIESQGVPHVEVDLILVNGNSVDFNYHISPGDHISVYPEFELFDISPLIKLRPSPLRNPAFIVDANLGRLARYLRMLGFNTRYDQNCDDPEIIRLAEREKRIILTRDIGILKHGKVKRGYFIRNQEPDRQIREVINLFNLQNLVKPFVRCIACNGEIAPVGKDKIMDDIPHNTRLSFNEFYQCDSCGRIYWKGSHYERMIEKIRNLLSE